MKHFRVGFVILTFIGCTAFGSEAVDNMIKLRRAGIEREVMLAFVRTSAITYDLTSDEIQKLEDNDVSATVIIAMLDHDREMEERARTGTVVATSAPAARAEWDQVSTTTYAPRAEEMNVSFFYEALAPHGSWHQDREFGWVWQPEVATRNRHWKPYSHGGQWVWSDHGWYFESSYDWGWAAFHYGRWHRSEDRNWVWVPGTEWAPSWVDWRKSDTHIGWAPLPPESRYEQGVGFTFRNKRVGVDFNFGLGDRDYNFVRSDRFLDRDLGTVLVPETNVTNVYNQTTVVNNTYVYNDNRIINRGIAPEIVSRAAQREIKPVQVVAMNISEGQRINPEQRTENKIVTFKPQVAAAAPIDPRAAIQRREASRSRHQQAEIKADAAAGIQRAAPKAAPAPATAQAVPAAPVNETDARKRLMEEKARTQGRGNRRTPSSVQQQPAAQPAQPLQPEARVRSNVEQPAAPVREIKPATPAEASPNARERATEAARAESARNEAAKAAAAKDSADREAASRNEAAAKAETARAENARAQNEKNEAARAAGAARAEAAKNEAAKADAAREATRADAATRRDAAKAEAAQAAAVRDAAAKAEDVKKDAARAEAAKVRAAAKDAKEAEQDAKQDAAKAAGAQTEAARLEAAKAKAAAAEAARAETAKLRGVAKDAKDAEKDAAKDVKDAEKDAKRKIRDDDKK